jgi:hypothetical protein
MTDAIAYWVLVFGFGGSLITIAAIDFKHPFLIGMVSAGILGLVFARAGGMI